MPKRQQIGDVLTVTRRSQIVRRRRSELVHPSFRRPIEQLQLQHAAGPGTTAIDTWARGATGVPCTRDNSRTERAGLRWQPESNFRTPNSGASEFQTSNKFKPRVISAPCSTVCPLSRLSFTHSVPYSEPETSRRSDRPHFSG